MTQRAVVSTQALAYVPVTGGELAIGIEYAKKEYGKDIDSDMLKVLTNTVMRRREPRTILPFLTATVVREVIPQHNKLQAPKIDAYKGAIMKIMSGRSAKKRQADAKKRAQGITVAPRPKPVVHPDDPKHIGQLLLL